MDRLTFGGNIIETGTDPSRLHATRTQQVSLGRPGSPEQMPHPAYQPSAPPRSDAVYCGQDERQAAELLTLTCEFFPRPASLRAGNSASSLTGCGCYPAGGLGWFLDGLQLTN